MNSTYNAGAVAEHIAAARLLALGYDVYWPASRDGAHDLLIAQRGDFLKVQVKKASWDHRGKNSYLSVGVMRRRGGGRRNEKAIRYTATDFDLLCAIDGERMWMIPFVELAKYSRLSLDKAGPGPFLSWSKTYNPSRWLVK